MGITGAIQTAAKLSLALLTWGTLSCIMSLGRHVQRLPHYGRRTVGHTRSLFVGGAWNAIPAVGSVARQPITYWKSAAGETVNLSLGSFIALTGATSALVFAEEADTNGSDTPDRGSGEKGGENDPLYVESPHKGKSRAKHLRALPPRVSGSSLETLPNKYNNGDELDFDLRTLVANVLEIYAMNPKEQFFKDMYTHDAVFEDPLMRLLGRKMIKFGFKGIEKGFKQSRTLQWHVQLVKYSHDGTADQNRASEESYPSWYKPSHPTDRAVILWLHHLYEPKVVRTPIEMVTAVRLYIDDDGKIVRHEDLFYGVELPNFSNSGILGGLSQLMRFVNGYLYSFFYIIFCDLWE